MTKLILSMILTGAAIFSLVVVTSFGCGSPDQLGKGGNNGTAGEVTVKLDANPSGNGSSGGGGSTGSTGPLPTGDANCGTDRNSTTHEPADVLLVLDRSGSMNNDIGEECQCVGSGTGGVDDCADKSTCTDRWSTVSSAVTTTVSSTPDIRWGLKLYSTSGNGCSVSNQPEVPIGTNSASSIQSRIQSTTPNSYTPTAAAITRATEYLKTVNDPNNKVILLATDGQPNCKDGKGDSADVDGTIAAITAAREAGFLVYVIGIGPEVGNLDKFAVAGGTTQYYPATSPAELASALAAISTAVVTCTFTLSSHPGADMNNVAVYLDKNLVAKDDANGWSFGANQTSIVLNGSTCDKVTSGAASNVEVIFGCPGYKPPDIIP